jgi:hypothetical protein
MIDRRRHLPTPAPGVGLLLSGVLAVALGMGMSAGPAEGAGRATRTRTSPGTTSRMTSPAAAKTAPTATSAQGKTGTAAGGKGTARDAGKKGAASADDEEMFLQEGADTRSWLPDIFRCAECGYEQDEPGTCPDHDQTDLVKVRSQGRNPLEPADVDGNEDLLVDLPLHALEFRPAVTASPTASVPGSGQKPAVPAPTRPAPSSRPGGARR